MKGFFVIVLAVLLRTGIGHASPVEMADPSAGRQAASLESPAPCLRLRQDVFPPDCLASRVRIDALPGSREHAMLSAALERIVRGPVGAELADAFLRTGRPASVSFVDIPGTTILKWYEGKKILYGPGGFFDIQEFAVRLNKGYLETDPGYAAVEVAESLAHELLGHGLGYALALREDAAWTFNNYVADDLWASVAGWIVNIESGNGACHAHCREYLRDPASYVRDLRLIHPHYAMAMTRTEMLDPVGSLNDRLDWLRSNITHPERLARFEAALTERIKLYTEREDMRLLLLKDLKKPFFDTIDQAVSHYTGILRPMAAGAP